MIETGGWQDPCPGRAVGYGGAAAADSPTRALFFSLANSWLKNAHFSLWSRRGAGWAPLMELILSSKYDITEVTSGGLGIPTRGLNILQRVHKRVQMFSPVTDLSPTG